MALDVCFFDAFA
ncbi:hypothetical protein O1C77_003631 [Vibrio cholerae]|nr:hypothetical protein [Vibrio cholerae]EKE8763121.1 hypothetical protein [Vibrio cholerae]EKF9299223.1 hypothetical protein [Vibrio cholerae]EKF9659559.1 hypothetical protein [Vibrio cholerae]EKF9678381.1 hypothetical protein [Vibrio cholerae]